MARISLTMVLWVTSVLCLPTASYCQEISSEPQPSAVATMASNLYVGLCHTGKGMLNVALATSHLYKGAAIAFNKVTNYPTVSAGLLLATMGCTGLYIKGQYYRPLINTIAQKLDPFYTDSPTRAQHINNNKLYTWRAAQWPEAGDIKNNALAVKTELVKRFRGQMRVGVSDIEIINEINTQIAREKDELIVDKTKLAACLSTYRLTYGWWASSPATGVDVRWSQLHPQTKWYADADQADINNMHDYCNDNWWDPALDPLKFIKRTFLYPLETNAAQAYWRLILVIERLNAIEEILS